MKDKLKNILTHYGLEPQIRQYAEESGELFKALNTCLRKSSKGQSDDTIRDNIVEEIADVTIMLEQMKIAFDVSDAEVEKIMDFKINRTLNLVLIGGSHD